MTVSNVTGAHLDQAAVSPLPARSFPSATALSRHCFGSSSPAAARGQGPWGVNSSCSPLAPTRHTYQFDSVWIRELQDLPRPVCLRQVCYMANTHRVFLLWGCLIALQAVSTPARLGELDEPVLCIKTDWTNQSSAYKLGVNPVNCARQPSTNAFDLEFTHAFHRRPATASGWVKCRA